MKSKLIKYVLFEHIDYDRLSDEAMAYIKNGVALMPQTRDWCSSCDGSGKRSSFDEKGLDIDYLLDDDVDGSFRESYFGGKTDVPCSVCRGKGIVDDVDFENCSEPQKEILMVDSQCIWEYGESDRISAAERAMGA